MVNKDLSLKKLIKLKVLDSNIVVASDSPYKITVQLDKFIPSRSLRSSHITLTGGLEKSKIKKINLDLRTKLLVIQVAPFENLNNKLDNSSRVLIPLCNSKKAGYVDLNLLYPSVHTSFAPISKDVENNEEENNLNKLSVKVKLTNAAFNTTLTPADFSLGRSFKNMTIDSISRIDSYTSILTLAYEEDSRETNSETSGKTGEILINPSATNSLITLSSLIEI